METSRVLWWGGLATAACGAVLCVVGWYGVSGERFAARQIPYLASCTVPGAALLVAGAVLLAAASAGRAATLAEAASAERAAGQDGSRPSDEPGPEVSWNAPSSQEPPLRTPGGTLAHRPDCPLVAGKPEAVPVGDEELAPCPVCEPWRP
ncbi:hypothetical protein AB0M39_19570 [Streptomyces sp. NPDC051907]|uniref:hypothetical protein n=1 Tax=Streptomyces sp. NPDC051907 TaxID=3155284 RepID=UPI00342C9068